MSESLTSEPYVAIRPGWNIVELAVRVPKMNHWRDWIRYALVAQLCFCGMDSLPWLGLIWFRAVLESVGWGCYSPV